LYAVDGGDADAGDGGDDDDDDDEDDEDDDDDGGDADPTSGVGATAIRDTVAKCPPLRLSNDAVNE